MVPPDLTQVLGPPQPPSYCALYVINVQKQVLFSLKCTVSGKGIRKKDTRAQLKAGGNWRSHDHCPGAPSGFSGCGGPLASSAWMLQPGWPCPRQSLLRGLARGLG